MSKAEMPEGDGSSVPGWAHSHKKVSVDVNSLTDIQQHLHDELHHNFGPNYRAIAPDLRKSDFGQHPAFEEAHFIASVHDGMLKDADDFVKKYQTGLQSLSAAAGYMAQEYGGADGLSASHISKVEAERAFNPGKGDRSVTGKDGNGAAEGTTPPTPVSEPPTMHGDGAPYPV